MKCLEGQTTEFDSTAQGRQRFDNYSDITSYSR